MIKLLAIAFLAGSFFTPLQTKSIYDFNVPSFNGGTIDFAAFKGKKILIEFVFRLQIRSLLKYLS
mgnify:CR=1 FL=1